MNPIRDFAWQGINYRLEVSGGSHIYSRQDGRPMSDADMNNVNEWYRLLPDGTYATTNPQLTMQNGQQAPFSVQSPQTAIMPTPAASSVSNSTWVLLGAGVFLLLLIRD